MNEKLKFILITFLVPLILIILSIFVSILLMIVALTWMGISLLIFHPLEEE